MNPLHGHHPTDPESERIRSILRNRAKTLARVPHDDNSAGDDIGVLYFRLGHDVYGIDTVCVREVYALHGLTPLPCTPPHILGILNVRGEIISVMDLAILFGLPRRELDDQAKVIVAQSQKMEFGIVADRIVEFGRVSLRSLAPSLPTLTDVRGSYLRGITRDRAVILDSRKMLEDEAIVVKGQEE